MRPFLSLLPTLGWVAPLDPESRMKLPPDTPRWTTITADRYTPEQLERVLELYSVQRAVVSAEGYREALPAAEAPRRVWDLLGATPDQRLRLAGPLACYPGGLGGLGRSNPSGSIWAHGHQLAWLVEFGGRLAVVASESPGAEDARAEEIPSSIGPWLARQAV